MEDPKIKLVTPQGEVLNMGLWALIMYHISSGQVFLCNLDETKLSLNDEEVERPLYEAEEVGQ